MSARPTDPMRDARSAHEARFFVDMLQFSRLVLLFGEPGAGKTALLREWVIPALRAEAKPAGTPHVVYFDDWNATLLDALDTRIEAALPQDLVQQSDTPRLRFGPWSDRLAAWTARPGTSLVLVFDHFERYLYKTAGEGVDTFARQWIAALAAPALNVRFLLALRSSAETLLMQRFGGRIAGLADNRVVLPPPRRRVAEPLSSAGLDATPSASANESASGAAAIGLDGTDSTPASVDATASSGVDTTAPAPGGIAKAAPDARAESPSGIAPSMSSRSRADRARPAHITAPARAEPWFDPVTPPSGVAAAKVRPAAPQADEFEDDLFGPEPGPGAEPPPRRERPRSALGRTVRLGTLAIGVGAAVAISAVLLVPVDDARVPLRARNTAASGGNPIAPPALAALGVAPATPGSTPVAPVDATPAPGASSTGRRGPSASQPSPAGPGTTTRTQVGSSTAPVASKVPPDGTTAGRGAPSGAPVAPNGPIADASTHTQPATTAGAAPADGDPPANGAAPAATPPSESGPLVAASPPASRVGAPAPPGENDAATAMARDIGSVLASDRENGAYVRAGIGATAANAPRTAADLFVARYDVLDALRGADSGDRRNLDRLQLLVPLQVEPIYFVVRREEPYSFVHEIAGKRINLGAGGTDAALGAAQLYLRLFDAPISSQRASYLPDAEALDALIRERSVDAVVLVGRAGFGALTAQRRSTPGAFKLLAFDSANPAGRRALRSYLSMDLAPVPGNAWMSHRLPALAVMSFLVGRDMDEERAGRVVRALCQHRSRLRSAGHPYWLSIAFNPVNAPGWRYAAGAERELRACSARWSAGPDPHDPAQPVVPLMSRLESGGAAR